VSGHLDQEIECRTVPRSPASLLLGLCRIRKSNVAPISVAEAPGTAAPLDQETIKIRLANGRHRWMLVVKQVLAVKIVAKN
jgi:hypothetical protein